MPKYRNSPGRKVWGFGCIMNAHKLAQEAIRAVEELRPEILGVQGPALQRYLQAKSSFQALLINLISKGIYGAADPLDKEILDLLASVQKSCCEALAEDLYYEDYW